MRLRTISPEGAASPRRDENGLLGNDTPWAGRTGRAFARAHALPPLPNVDAHIDPQLSEQLRGVLSALAEGQSVQRTPQRIVLAGVNTLGQVPLLAATMAITSASAGYRVLLVDANFHQPSLHETFGLRNEVGLVSLLASADPPHFLPQETTVPNLAVITTGPESPNAASLLHRERVFHRLEPLAGFFDCIIIDGSNLPPAQVSRISGGADHVVIAVKEHISSMRDLANMVGVLRGEGFASPAVLMIA